MTRAAASARRARPRRRATPVAVASRREDLPAIDWIKAAAIVAVTITHALDPSDLDQPPDLDRWLHFAVQFCVVAFLFASGVLLAQGGRLDGSMLRRRLRRLLVPYLVASAVAQLTGLSGAGGAARVAFQIATGASLFIYYYVFLLVVCLLLTWVVERFPGPAAEVVLVALSGWAMLTTVLATGDESVFWFLRNPLHFYGYFLAGIVAWRHRSTLARFATGTPARAAAVACVLAIAAYFVVGPRFFYTSPAGGILKAVYTSGVVGLIALVAWRREPPAAVRFLSRSSYAIYLYHFFFERLVGRFLGFWPAAPRIATIVGAGLAGATLVCLVGVALFPTRARLLLGV